MKELKLNDEEQLLEFSNSLRERPRTKFVKFENNTSQWWVEIMLYEVKQKRNLPPKNGYVQWTEVTVGATDIWAGLEVYAYLTKIVLGDFIDCGLVNVKNKKTGRRIKTVNFKDKIAPIGKHYVSAVFGIKPKSKKNDEESLVFTFKGELEDGSMDKQEFNID